MPIGKQRGSGMPSTAGHAAGTGRDGGIAPRAAGTPPTFPPVAVTAPALRRWMAERIARRKPAARGEAREAWRPNWTR